MASENHNKKPLVIERRRGKERKKTPRLTKTYEVKIIPATIGVVMETEEPPKKRVAAYCRVSTDQEAQETSLEEQMAHFNTVIAEHSDGTLYPEDQVVMYNIDDVKPGEEKKRRGRRKKSEIEAEQKAKEE